MSRDWIFRVRAATLPGEVVCVTGSCPELGCWKVDNVVRMTVEKDASDSLPLHKRSLGWTESIWTVSIAIPDGVEISYRFCICTFISPDERRLMTFPIVRHWETMITPRKIPCHDNFETGSDVIRFGYVDGSEVCSSHKGWLTRETVVQLKLFGPKSVEIWKRKHANKRIFIKLTPIVTNESSSKLPTTGSFEVDESQDLSDARQIQRNWPIVEVAKLCESDCSVRPQSQFGIEYNDEDFILFKAQMLVLPTVAFLVDFYAAPKSPFHNGQRDGAPEFEVAPDHIGFCYIMPIHFKTSEGKIQLTIVSKRLYPVGQFTTHFSVIRPMPDSQCDFSVSYAHHWKPHWKGLDVGHRGLGNSYTKSESCSMVRENTIGSLKDAASHGADMVEFDVQLSQDLVPVVYHDFELLASITNKVGDKQMLVQMPLKNLTLEQLQQLRIYHRSEKTSGFKDFHEETDVERQPFPTLQKVLEDVDVHIGFNIELKWDMELPDGSRSSKNAFEMNLFVDTVLETVMNHAGKRKIVYSSFNPDVCYAARLKQNRYPVLFLTQGVHSKYQKYLDPRTHSVAAAAYFAHMIDILGVNPIAEDLLKDPHQIDLVKNKFKLILFTWTDDRNDASTVKSLKELGVDGVIYDRMDTLGAEREKKKSVFLLDLEQEHVPANLCSCDFIQTSLSSPNGSDSSGISVNEVEELPHTGVPANKKPETLQTEISAK